MADDEKQVSGRERSLANLKPFKPGQSGNPAGRPKDPLSKALRKKLGELESDEPGARTNAEAVLDKLVELAVKHPTGRERQLAALEPHKFKPGQSGNPAGRPKGRPQAAKVVDVVKVEVARRIEEVFTNGWLNMLLKGNVLNDGMQSLKLVIDKRKYNVRFTDETDDAITIQFTRRYNTKRKHIESAATAVKAIPEPPPASVAPIELTLGDVVSATLRKRPRTWDELLDECRKRFKRGMDVEDELGILLGELTGCGTVVMTRVGGVRQYRLNVEPPLRRN